MDNDKKSGGGLPTSGLWLVVALAAGALFVREVPLRGSRPPATDPKPYPYEAVQDVDARLWQDPLTAVARAREDLRKREASAKPREVTCIRVRSANAQDPSTVEFTLNLLHDGSPCPPATSGSVAATAAGTAPVTPAPAPASDAVPKPSTSVGASGPDATSPPPPTTEAAADSASPPDPEGGSHSAEALRKSMVEREKQAPAVAAPRSLRAIGVLVQGGSFAEAVEARRRARYAVLAALKREGYTPRDAAHLGYFLPVPDKRAISRLPEFIAYEEFIHDQRPPLFVLWLDEYAFAPHTRGRIAALMESLSLSVRQFVVVGPTYSSTLRDMAIDDKADREQVGPHRTARPQAPETTRQDTTDDPLGTTTKGLTFYAYGATSDDTEILKGTPLAVPPESFKALPPADGLLHAAFDGVGLRVFRAVNNDRQLVSTLRNELALRGVEPEKNARCGSGSLQHVVLIAEWDTLYGRTLPELMTSALRPAASGCSASVDRYVHRYSYLRGLDGQLPALESATDSDGKASSAGGPARSADRSDLQRQIERPDGQGQLDYLRRVVADLQALDRGWRRSDGGSIAAVGVLGSDVFDKLLILQALRADFPGAVFFTTDLDARMLHPVEQDWARNLVVASSFGLQLRPELQQDIPPFRDTYQTSVFFSTLLAISDVIRDDRALLRFSQSQIIRGLDESRVFEIGRRNAFDLSGSMTHLDCRPGAPCIETLEPARLADGLDSSAAANCTDPAAPPLDHALCFGIHPPRSPMSPTSRPALLYKELLLIVLAALLALFVFGCWRLIARRRADSAPQRSPSGASPADRAAASVNDPSTTTSPRTRRRSTDISLTDWLRARRDLVVLLGITIVIAVVALLGGPTLYNGFVDWVVQRNEGEPINFVEGISIWPTELIRAFVVIFSGAFVVLAWRKLVRNLQDISRDFRFEPVYREMVVLSREHYSEWPWWKRTVRVFSFRLSEADGGPQRHIAGLAWSAQLFWEKYLYQGRLLSRGVRVALCVMIFWALGYWIISHFGIPNIPYRGSLSRHIDQALLGLSVTSMLTVLFFVVDALVFCIQLIQALQNDILGDRLPMGQATDLRWADSTRKFYAERLGVSDRRLDVMILMDFIVARTGTVASLVYYPFVVIALMVFARSHAIDNWTMPAGLVFIFIASVVIIVSCAVRLRMAAEQARRSVLEFLVTENIRLRKEGSGSGADQVEAMIARVRNLQRGAFAPYSQQPILRALLLPLTTLGGPALLDFLSSTSF